MASPPPYDAYVICTSPRSGSTLLCDLLQASGVAGAPKSYFHRPDLDDWLSYLDLSPAAHLSHRQRLAAAVDAAIARGRAQSDIFGVRLQRHSFAFFTEQLAVLHPSVDTDRARIEAAFGRTAFIHLTRPDKLAQAISYVKARQTGLWHAAPDGTELERLSPPAPPRYDADALRAQIAEFGAFDEAWERWFAQQTIAPLRLTYDALAVDPLAVLRRVLEQLGLDPIAAAGVDPGTAKLADATSQAWATRFRAECA